MGRSAIQNQYFTDPLKLGPGNLSNSLKSLNPLSENSFAYDGDTKQRLSDKTICMIAEHRMGDKTYLHYDVHSMYGHTNAIATYK